MTEPKSQFFTATDGLRLHALIYGEAGDATPVVCLPGLTRPARDFDKLARVLRAESGRQVICLDYRGRGGSDWDADWTHYSIPVEETDILSVLAELNIASAIFIGWSRGGIHAIFLGANKPDLVKAIVLDDVGPVFETAGLAHIKAYVGKLPLLRDWDEAVAHFKRCMGDKFTSLTEADWLFYAHNTLTMTPERLRFSYDPQVARAFDGFDPTAPMPDLWKPFCAVSAPILALRGENSDLLTPATLAEMAARHPKCQTHVVPGQGHAPLLTDMPTLERVGLFVKETA